MLDRISRALNWVLTANFFLVLASFIWFMVALLGRSFKLSWGLDLWYSLWQPLFSPAIGLLMAGAIVSGLGRWGWQRWQTWKSNLNP